MVQTVDDFLTYRASLVQKKNKTEMSWEIMKLTTF